MLLIICQQKKTARSISETFYYMSMLSYAATPAEALSEVCDDYRAALILNPERFPDISDYVRRLMSYKSNLPIFALTSQDPSSLPKNLFDHIFTVSQFTPAIAKKMVSYCNKHFYAKIGDYYLAGFNASSNIVGAEYFDTPIKLTRTETMILRYLMRTYPIPRDASSILKYAFRHSKSPEPSSIRTHISIMNKKFMEQYGRKMIAHEGNDGYRIITPEFHLIK